MAALLSRQAILDAKDLPTQTVEVPEWNGSVIVRTLTGEERDNLEATTLVQKGKKMSVNLSNFRARLVSLSVVDQQGKAIFTESDVELLGKKSAIALDRVAKVAQELSGLKEDDVEKLTKN